MSMNTSFLFAAALALFAAPTVQASTPAPSDFYGTYTLAQTRAGSCFREIELYGEEIVEGQIDIRDGNLYYFPAVNAGPQTTNDDIVRITTNSYTADGGRLIAERRMITGRAYPTLSRSVTTATLNGNSLRIHTRDSQLPSDAPAIHFETECVYRRSTHQ